MSERTRRMMNLDLIDRFDCGDGGVPMLEAASAAPERLIAFNALSRVGDDEAKSACVHFFLDDYRFEGVWREPLRYVEMLSRFRCVLTPDFSLYLDMPEPMQRWNTYRSRVVGAVWQAMGICVIPTISWADTPSYGFCFDGVPQRSTIALSTVGLMDTDEGKALFQAGAGEACRRLRPRQILGYGRPFAFNAYGASVEWYPSEIQVRYAAMRAAKKEGRG